MCNYHNFFLFYTFDFLKKKTIATISNKSNTNENKNHFLLNYQKLKQKTKKTDELLAEKEKYKNISEELDQTLNELQGY